LSAADVAFNVHGGISVLSRSIEQPTPCLNSTMMNAMVHFMLDGLQLTDIHPASHARPPNGVAAGSSSSSSSSSAGSSKAEQQHKPLMRVVWALRTNRAGFQTQILDELQRRLPAESGAEVGGWVRSSGLGRWGGAALVVHTSAACSWP
jgi:hypothetical protein